MDPLTLMAIGQGVGGLLQTISGGIQRQRAEKAARAQVEKLGPDESLLSLHNQALQRYSGLRAGEGAMQKQYTRGAQQNLASILQQYRRLGPGGILAGGASALRAANEGVMKGATVGEQMSGQALSQLGSITQAIAAEKRRQKELKLQMDLQKAAGGTQIANVGMSNIFDALTSLGGNLGTGGAKAGKSLPSLGSTYKTGTMTRTPVGTRASTIPGPRISATPSSVRRP